MLAVAHRTVARAGVAPTRVAMRVIRGERTSVSAVVYPSDPADRVGLPLVEVYTTAGCPLCDTAVEVLRSVKLQAPHTLQLQDITDFQHRGIFREMKHEIPVLHINGKFWAKHRITADEAVVALRDS